VNVRWHTKKNETEDLVNIGWHFGKNETEDLVNIKNKKGTQF